MEERIIVAVRRNEARRKALLGDLTPRPFLSKRVRSIAKNPCLVIDLIAVLFVTLKIGVPAVAKVCIESYIAVRLVTATANAILQAPAVDDEVFVVVPKDAAIVVVDALDTTVVWDDEVVVCDVEVGNERRLACSYGRQKRLSVPAIDRPVVAGLTARVEDEVLEDLVTAAEAVVDVDPCSGKVEDDIVRKSGLCTLRLKPSWRLLLVDAGLTDEVSGHQRVARVVPGRTVQSMNAAVAQLICTPPGSHCTASRPGKLIVCDCCIPIVATEHYSIAVQALKGAVCNHQLLSSFKEESAHALQSPVSSTRHAVWVEVCVRRVAKTNARKGNVLYWRFLRTSGVEKYLQRKIRSKNYRMKNQHLI